MQNLPEEQPQILVVDDDAGLLASIGATLSSAGLAAPALLSDSRPALDWVRQHRFPLVLLDLMMPHVSGLDLLQGIKNEFPATEVIILTAMDDTDTAVQAMKFGAYDFLVKPVSREKLLITIHHALEHHSLRQGLDLLERPPSFESLKHPEMFSSIIARDEAMARVFNLAENLGPTDYNVVITGESGTGKEMLAHVLHRLSSRARAPFVALNMAAFSQGLFEDQFFGHNRGAFTGAVAGTRGFFEKAAGGTLFLDEITELDLPLQAKLLRVIQEKELYRLGSTTVLPVDVRIIASSNRDLTSTVEAGAFRRDLYYRLNTGHIHIPPLRERLKDILPLALHFLRKHAQEVGKDISTLDPALESILLASPLPGNVRELENIIASAVLLEKGTVLTPASAATHLAAVPAKTAPSLVLPSQPLPTLASVERDHILTVLDQTGGNRTQAARILDIGLRTLQRKLKAYGLASGE